MSITYVILTCEAYLPTRCKAIRDTWLNDVSNYVFLSAHPNEAENVLGWNTPDNRDSCSKKYIEFFRNHTLDSDWIVFCDDDTFVFPSRLEAFLQTKNPDDSLYIGYEFPGCDPPGGLSGGAGFVLSRTAYTQLCSYLRSTDDVWVSTYSDVSISIWLLKRMTGVRKLEDSRFHPRLCWTPHEFQSAFTFHYVTPDKMYQYHTSSTMPFQYDISILIPTMHNRKRLFEQALADVRRQIQDCPEIRVEVLWEADNGELTLGQKRNILVDRCNGKYHCFVDDDDILAPDFLRTFVPMIQSGIEYDCASFVGAHYQKGKFNKLFHHSLDYPEWEELPDRYIRSVSPMNMIRTSIVRQVRYKDIRNTEDHEFSKRLMASGLLTLEYKINPNHPIYHYIDGVKQDREEWQYRWSGEYLILYKPLPPSQFQFKKPSSDSSVNVIHSFLKNSHP